MVANKFLEDIDMDDNMRLQCVSMCQHFHQVRVREREREGRKHLISCTHKLSLF